MMKFKLVPGVLAAAALMVAAAPAQAHPSSGKADCCGAAMPQGKQDACCEAEKPKGKKDDCCEAEGGMRGMKDHGGKKDHGRMWGHHGILRGLTFGPEIRYMPVMGGATNQWLVLSGEIAKRKNDWYSIGFQRNLALQTFNNGPEGFWIAPYGGLLPTVGYRVGEARADIGVLVGAGAMARTAMVGGTADVLQARLMWVVEPRVELMWQGQGHGLGLVGTYLMTQHQADLGGFSIGIKGTWGPRGMSRRGDGHGDQAD